MSHTIIRSRPVSGLLHAPEKIKAVDYSWETPVKVKEEIVWDFPLDGTREALWAYLCELNKTTPTDSEAEAEAGKGQPGVDSAQSAATVTAGSKMERKQGIAALRHQLEELHINDDDELFKSSCMNVGKYVVGPAPIICQSGEADPEGTETFESTKDKPHASETAAQIDKSASETDGIRKDATHKHDEEGLNDGVQAVTLVDADGSASMVASTAFDNDHDFPGNKQDLDDGQVPPVPPTTPDGEERIWWKNDSIVIKKSQLGGLGAFAAKDLDAGETILEEMPLLVTNNWSLVNEVDTLSEEDRELFFSLHKFSFQPDTHVIEKIRKANSFQLPHGVAIYSVTSRFNHACMPVRSVNYDINRTDGKITLTTRTPVAKGAELTICYGGNPEQLLQSFGFRCQCGGCTPLTDEQAAAIISSVKGEACWWNSGEVASAYTSRRWMR